MKNCVQSQLISNHFPARPAQTSPGNPLLCLMPGFEYVIQSPGTGIPTGSGTPVQGTSAVAQNLQPQTQYELYVRSVCTGSVYGNWSGPVTFKTYPATTSIPANLTYNESFEGESRWTMLEPVVGNQWVRSDSDAGGLYGPSDGDYYLRHDDIDNNSNSWVISRGINLPAGKENYFAV